MDRRSPDGVLTYQTHVSSTYNFFGARFSYIRRISHLKGIYNPSLLCSLLKGVQCFLGLDENGVPCRWWGHQVIRSR